MLPLLRCQEVDLAAPRRKRSGVLSPDTKQDQFGDITEVETNAATIRAAVLANLVPHQIALVLESPGFHYAQAFRQQGIRNP